MLDPAVGTMDMTFSSPVVPDSDFHSPLSTPLSRVVFDNGAPLCPPSTSSGNRKRNSDWLLTDDMRHEIEKKMQGLDKKNCILTVFSIPSNLFLAPHLKAAMILLNPYENFPFLVIKTKPFMKGLASLFYIITFQKMSKITELAKSLFSKLDGYDEKFIESAKLHEISFEAMNFQKSLEIMTKILKLFFNSVDISMIVRQLKDFERQSKKRE